MLNISHGHDPFLPKSHCLYQSDFAMSYHVAYLYKASVRTRSQNSMTTTRLPKPLLLLLALVDSRTRTQVWPGGWRKIAWWWCGVVAGDKSLPYCFGCSSCITCTYQHHMEILIFSFFTVARIFADHIWHWGLRGHSTPLSFSICKMEKKRRQAYR